MTTTTTAGPVGTSRRKFNWAPVVYLSPILALFLVFIVFPFARGIWFSVNEVSFLGQPLGFVGLDNFVSIVTGPNFGRFALTSVIWTVGAVTLQLVVGAGGAFLLNQRFRLRGAVRGLAMIPWATPSVLVALMWLWILEPNNGLLNKVLISAGAIDAPVAWLGSSDTALATLIFIDAWQGVPFFMVMILAALQGVPGELIESARTDGAGHFGVFRHVVLPAIVPTVLITVVLRLIWTANYIDLTYVLTGGGPAYATTTLPLASYLTAYKGGDFGEGAAYAMIQAAVLAVMVVFYIRLTSKGERR
jgi:multiple sugar transport system permease protein